ncbi:FAD-dependent oxidoreductase [Streptomyces sp. NE06-03E]|uniref:NAD(P)/FAD-dependent oxidoreductase n=1 Tax=unclassified Streptomyces TaxID=2593676 RepID=UPI0029B0A160|nr:FAD-dependent oxidoreductase [Streptomyces sp. NBC_01422]MDX3054318.1 FAD-dependent oxidoreductase [Streptomyces sp. NE06-03E]
MQLDRHVRVTLITMDGNFTERVRQHELAAGRPAVTHPLSKLLRTSGIERITARVTGIDASARCVHTDTGVQVGYDRLVYALGSRTAGIADDVPGRVYTAESAAELRKRLIDAPGVLTVVGAGLTGIEMAAEVAETYPDWEVRLRTGGHIAPSISEGGREHIRSFLHSRDVHIEEGQHVTGPEDLDTDVIVWAASMTPNTQIAVAAGLSTDDSNQVLVDSSLRSVSHPEIYVAGDAASVQTAKSGRIRMACATALPLGRQVANSVIKDLQGEEPDTFKFAYQAQCMSLGRHDGLVQFVGADDSPAHRIVTGRLAAMIKEQVVRTTVRTVRMDARYPRVAGLIPGVN